MQWQRDRSFSKELLCLGGSLCNTLRLSTGVVAVVTSSRPGSHHSRQNQEVLRQRGFAWDSRNSNTQFMAKPGS